jgi:hypothetical protein
MADRLDRLITEAFQFYAADRYRVDGAADIARDLSMDHADALLFLAQQIQVTVQARQQLGATALPGRIQ